MPWYLMVQFCRHILADHIISLLLFLDHRCWPFFLPSRMDVDECGAYVSLFCALFLIIIFIFLVDKRLKKKPQRKKLCKCNSHAIRILFLRCVYSDIHCPQEYNCFLPYVSSYNGSFVCALQVPSFCFNVILNFCDVHLFVCDIGLVLHDMVAELNSFNRIGGLVSFCIPSHLIPPKN
jgi:hypothetical protein